MSSSQVKADSTHLKKKKASHHPTRVIGIELHRFTATRHELHSSFARLAAQTNNLRDGSSIEKTPAYDKPSSEFLMPNRARLRGGPSQVVLA
jgi:hypothetical protein